MDNNNTTPNTPIKPGCGCTCGQVKPPVTPPSNGNDTCGTCMGMVGYAFVPVQTFNDIYTPENGLSNGTIFPELNKPFGMYGAEVG